MVTNVDGLARCGLRAYERAHGLGTGLNTQHHSHRLEAGLTRTRPLKRRRGGRAQAEDVPMGQRAHPRRHASRKRVARCIPHQQQCRGRLRGRGARACLWNSERIGNVQHDRQPVWEWVDDYWSVDHPRTPKNSPPLFDPRGTMSTGERTKKGGSYMCHKSYCHRYRVHARSQNLGYGKPWVSLCQACSGDGAPSKIGAKIIHEPSKA